MFPASSTVQFAVKHRFTHTALQSPYKTNGLVDGLGAILLWQHLSFPDRLPGLLYKNQGIRSIHNLNGFILTRVAGLLHPILAVFWAVGCVHPEQLIAAHIDKPFTLTIKSTDNIE